MLDMRTLNAGVSWGPCNMPHSMMMRATWAVLQALRKLVTPGHNLLPSAVSQLSILTICITSTCFVGALLCGQWPACPTSSICILMRQRLSHVFAQIVCKTAQNLQFSVGGFG